MQLDVEDEDEQSFNRPAASQPGQYKAGAEDEPARPMSQDTNSTETESHTTGEAVQEHE